jgi:hypothetical protein
MCGSTRGNRVLVSLGASSIVSFLPAELGLSPIGFTVLDYIKGVFPCLLIGFCLIIMSREMLVRMMVEMTVEDDQFDRKLYDRLVGDRGKRAFWMCPKFYQEFKKELPLPRR